MRIQWKHDYTSDFRSSYGPGVRPMVQTTYPEGAILLSELPRAKMAARRAYARYHDVPVGAVTASPVYTESRTAVAHVNAYVAD